jgi:hypothetical protein
MKPLYSLCTGSPMFTVLAKHGVCERPVIRGGLKRVLRRD